MTSVRASIAVPRVLSRSPTGLAATWIGAQAKSGPGGSFIQVGVNEDVHSHGRPFYVGFWSDRESGLHPHFLYQVNPGDRLAASLQLIAGHWHLALKDLDAGKAWHLQTVQEATVPFNLAEWFQEDPVNGHSGSAEPYPALGVSLFRDLEVDSVPPSYAKLLSQWLTARGVDIGPGPLLGDAFALGVRTISSAGQRYLAIADREDNIENGFLRSAAGWTQMSARSEVLDACSTFRRALMVSIAALSHATWSSSERSRVASVISATRRLAVLTMVPPSSSTTGLARWRKRLLSVAANLGAVAHRLRRQLGLPQVVTNRR